MPDRSGVPTPSRRFTRLGVVQTSREETAGSPDAPSSDLEILRLWGFEITGCGHEVSVRHAVGW